MPQPIDTDALYALARAYRARIDHGAHDARREAHAALRAACDALGLTEADVLQRQKLHDGIDAEVLKVAARYQALADADADIESRRQAYSALRQAADAAGFFAPAEVLWWLDQLGAPEAA